MSPEKTEILPRASALFPNSSARILVETAYHPQRDMGTGQHQDGWERLGGAYATRKYVESLAAQGFTKVSLRGGRPTRALDVPIAGLL